MCVHLQRCACIYICLHVVETYTFCCNPLQWNTIEDIEIEVYVVLNHLKFTAVCISNAACFLDNILNNNMYVYIHTVFDKACLSWRAVWQSDGRFLFTAKALGSSCGLHVFTHSHMGVARNNWQSWPLAASTDAHLGCFYLHYRSSYSSLWFLYWERRVKENRILIWSETWGLFPEFG